MASLTSSGPALDSSDDSEQTPEQRLQYLRDRGVEVDLPEDRAKATQAAKAGGPQFAYVLLPQVETKAVVELRAHAAPDGASVDVLPQLLAPNFADDGAVLDSAAVEREAAGRLKNMMIGGSEGLAAPKASTIAQLAAGGACEAYPLCRASAENGQEDVKLYIDEIGALRGRGRNARAEKLAHACGLAGLSIHGDAFVGRTIKGRNAPFPVADLAPDSAWCVRARRTHEAQAAAAGISDTEHLAQGSDEQGRYSWTQTDDEVEVRVFGGPSGLGASKRVTVAYGQGDQLRVCLDGNTSAPLVALFPLFDRVDSTGCAWTLEKNGDIVVSLEKAQPRPWTKLVLSGHVD